MNIRAKTFISLLCLAFLSWSVGSTAQVTLGTENGEWRYIGGTIGHTRYSPLDQINANNFNDLEQSWIWRTDNFGPNVDYFSRSTPIYVDGILYTVATPRRQVIAMDPATGETLWTFREPETIRHQRSPRQAYGKGVTYGEINGRGVIYITTPGFFLWALDAKTGRPLEDWGGEWNRPYTREQACFPAGSFRVDKYWPPVNRIDNVHGDRNLICTCPPISDFEVSHDGN